MKISSTILLNFLFLLVVSCSSSAKDLSGDSSLGNIEEASLTDECLEDCSNSGVSLSDDDTPETEESNSVFQIKGLGCNSLQYGTGFFVEENIVVTSAHVVAGVNSPEIFYNGIGFDLDFIFKPIREFLGVDTPNAPTSTKIIVLPSVKQTAQQPSTQVGNEIPNFKISSGVKMRGLVGKALGIEDLVS